MGDSVDIIRFIIGKIHSLVPHSVVAVAIHDPDGKYFTMMSVSGDREALSALRFCL